MTSPPYWSLRDYGVPGQLGLEPTLIQRRVSEAALPLLEMLEAR